MGILFIVLSNYIILLHFKEKDFQEYIANCKESKSIKTIQNCFQVAAIKSHYHDLFFHHYDFLIGIFLEKKLNKEDEFDRLMTLKVLYPLVDKHDKEKVDKLEKFISKCLNLNVESYGICLSHYAEFLKQYKNLNEKEIDKIKMDFIHQKSFMNKMNQDCMRNQFYEIYVKENKDEYNQIFQNCGWKFGKEKNLLNEKINNFVKVDGSPDKRVENKNR